MKSFIPYAGLLGLVSESSLTARSPPSYGSNTPTVVIKNGTIEGVHKASYNQDYFLGVPFAQPPTGGNRFRNPQSIEKKFNGTLQAFDYADECFGYGSDQNGYPQSEDCLYLNVVRPSGYENEDLPIGVWIHGGGLTQGGTRDERYNLTFIVENSVKIGKPIIAMSIAYRLGIWGFIASDEVVEAGQTNIGLRDQRLALHWIQENIHAFGGDKEKVTIFGESAGAGSVGWHLTAYNGRDDGLFRAGIMQSGNPINYGGYYNISHWQPFYDNLISAVDCNGTASSLDCLRAVPVEILTNLFNSTDAASSCRLYPQGPSCIDLGLTSMPKVNPVIDNDFIALASSQQLADGSFVHVPIINGANSDEGKSFGPDVSTEAEFKSYLMNASQTSLYMSEELAEEVLALYPDTPEYWIPTAGNASISVAEGQQRRAFAYVGDAIMIANRRGAVEAWAREGVPAYSYRFNTIPANLDAVQHFQEVAFVFDNSDGLGYNAAHDTVNPFLDKPQSYFDLAELMSSSWASFIYDLNPNGFNGRYAKADAWPLYSLEDPKEIVWDANITELAIVEADTYRKEGIQWILEHADVLRR